MNNFNNIKLISSVKWSTTQWDLSFKEIIPLAQALPQLHTKYEIYLEDNEASNITSGIQHILWLPPHSELNGLDLRPKEILKAHIIEVDLNVQEWILEEYQHRRKCKVQVRSIFKLLDTPVTKSSLQGDLCLEKKIYRLEYYAWDHYVMIFQSDQYINYAWLFSVKDKDVNLHFINNTISSDHECLVLNKSLSSKQRKQFFDFLKKQPPLIPETQLEVAIDQVQGALYY